MRQVRTEAMMSVFHHTAHKQIPLKRPNAVEERLAVGQSLAIIVALSALSWAVLISIFVALRGLL
jgi:hypothetical protein